MTGVDAPTVIGGTGNDALTLRVVVVPAEHGPMACNPKRSRAQGEHDLELYFEPVAFGSSVIACGVTDFVICPGHRGHMMTQHSASYMSCARDMPIETRSSRIEHHGNDVGRRRKDRSVALRTR